MVEVNSQKHFFVKLCETHSNELAVEICLNEECDSKRFLCQSCISEHSTGHLTFSLQRTLLLLLFFFLLLSLSSPPALFLIFPLFFLPSPPPSSFLHSSSFPPSLIPHSLTPSLPPSILFFLFVI